MYTPQRAVQFLLSLCVLLLPALSAWRGNARPTPTCPFCIPASVRDAPGIGFDLTTSYGTAAVHLHDGTTLHLAKITGSPAYQTLMVRLSDVSAYQPTPLDPVARLQRWWNKLRGRPATADVGVLGEMFAELKAAAVRELTRYHAAAGGGEMAVGMSLPALPGLMDVDLVDALVYAGLRRWEDSDDDHGGGGGVVVTQARAAYVGNGHAVCASFPWSRVPAGKLFTFPCRSNEVRDGDGDGEKNAASAAPQLVLYVSLTRHALGLSLEVAGDGSYLSWAGVRDGPLVSSTDFGAGADAAVSLLSWYASEEDYWRYVSGSIVGFVQLAGRTLAQGKGQGGRPPPLGMVLVGGENGTEDAFVEMLREVLDELELDEDEVLPGGVGVASIVDPTFAAARGMALYAQRRQEAPGRCREWRYCRERWDIERGQGGQGGPNLR